MLKSVTFTIEINEVAIIASKIDELTHFSLFTSWLDPFYWVRPEAVLRLWIDYLTLMSTCSSFKHVIQFK